MSAHSVIHRIILFPTTSRTDTLYSMIASRSSKGKRTPPSGRRLEPETALCTTWLPVFRVPSYCDVHHALQP